MSVTIQGLFRSRSRHTLHLLVGQAALRARTIVGTSVLWAGETSYIHPTEVPDAIARLADAGVGLSATVTAGVLRAVTHLDIDDDDVEQALEAVPRALGVLERA